MSSTTFAGLAAFCRTPPVGYQAGLSASGGVISLVNADASTSGGGNCGGFGWSGGRSGCCSVQYQPSNEDSLVLIIGAHSNGKGGRGGPSLRMSMHPSA